MSDNFYLEDWFGTGSFEDPRAKISGVSEEEQLEFAGKILSEKNQALQYAIDTNDRED